METRARLRIRQLASLMLATLAGKGLGLVRELALATTLGIGAAFDHFLALTSAGVLAANALFQASTQHALVTGHGGRQSRRHAGILLPVTLLVLYPLLAKMLELGRADVAPYVLLAVASWFAHRAAEEAARLHRQGRGHVANMVPLMSTLLVIGGAFVQVTVASLVALLALGWVLDWGLMLVCAGTGPEDLVSAEAPRLSLVSLLLPHATLWIALTVDRWAALNFGPGTLSLVYIVNRVCLAPGDVATTTLTPYLLARSARLRQIRIGGKTVSYSVAGGTLAISLYGLVALRTDSLWWLAFSASLPLLGLLFASNMLQVIVTAHGLSVDLALNAGIRSATSCAVAVVAVLGAGRDFWLAAPLVSTASGLGFLAWRAAVRSNGG